MFLFYDAFRVIYEKEIYFLFVYGDIIKTLRR